MLVSGRWGGRVMSVRAGGWGEGGLQLGGGGWGRRAPVGGRAPVGVGRVIS